MSIDNTDDVIDSRDVIARIEELTGERDAHDADIEGTDADSWMLANPADAEELAALEALQSEAEGYSDWQHGAQLIRDSYFEKYAQELAEDLHGNALRDAQWPMSCIDWEKAASELQQDYTQVDFDGVAYWVRS